MDGWIKLHRKLLDCIIWLDSEPFDRRSAWIDLLLLANHSDKEILFNGEPIVISQGQYLTSVRKLALRWKWSNDRTLRYLRLLEQLQMIHKDSDNYRTLITIVNYGVYQTVPNADKYTDEYTDKSQTRKKERKNILPKGNIGNFVPPTLDDVKEYCQERGNKVDCQRWYDFYSSKGWMIGKNKMKDWKAAVRTWERADNNQKVVVQKKNDFNNFSTTANYDMDELERKLLGVNR